MEKLNWIDKTKTFAIILVVAAHAMIPAIRNNSVIIYNFRQIIYMFHMPLFMVLSGYLFEFNIEKYINRGFLSFIKNKAVRLMLPYLSLSIISYVGIGICMKLPILGTMLSKAGYEGRSFLTAVKEILLLTNHMDEHLWFIYTLFVIFIIEFLLHRVCISKIGIAVQVIAYLFISMLSMPEILSRVCMYTIFFTIGRLLTYKNIAVKPVIPIRIIQWLVMTVLIIGSIYFNGSDSIISNNWFLFKFARRVMALSTGVVCVFTVINLFALYGNTEFKHNGCLKMICDYEYGIYLLHQPFIVSGVVGILSMFRNSFPYTYIFVISGTIIGIIIPIVIVKIIRYISILRLLILGEITLKQK